MSIRLTSWLACPVIISTMLVSTSFNALGDELVSSLAGAHAVQWHSKGGAIARVSDLFTDDDPRLRSEGSELTFKINSENVVKGWRAGELVNDVASNGSETRFSHAFTSKYGSTNVGLSRSGNRTNILWNEVAETRTDIHWTNTIHSWNIDHQSGNYTLGLKGSKSSARLSGLSAYPHRVFGILDSYSDLHLFVDQSFFDARLSAEVNKRTRISIFDDTRSLSNYLELGKENNQVVIPANITMRGGGIEAIHQFSPKLSLLASSSSYRGDSSCEIYYNLRSSGKLGYKVRSDALDLSLCYHPDPKHLYYAGTSRRNNTLLLSAMSVRGHDLDIAIEPWNEKIDIAAKGRIETNTIYAGCEGNINDNWKWSAVFRKARISPSLGGEYVGRAFYGLLNVAGIYQADMKDYILYSLNLTTSYTRGRWTYIFEMEPAVPSANKKSKPQPQPQPEAGVSDNSEKTSFSGGPSLSASVTYSL